jgi:hypothetical protein
MPLRYLSGSLLFFSLQALFLVPRASSAVVTGPGNGHNAQSTTWQSSGAQHAYGLPDMKKNEKGQLTLNADGLTFAAKSSRASIPRGSILAVSAGNQRVELWGVKGRLLRMAIPDGGGLAAAGLMHHRVDILTVEFADERGGYHGAVFYLPASEADRALQRFAQMPAVQRDATEDGCGGNPVEPGSVLVAAPAWNQVEVPAVYRALVYEHLVDRLQQVQGVTHVYREGQVNARSACPQYTVHIAIAGFNPGSQVKRAVMGPVGMFAGTTQMTFDATFADASGEGDVHQQVKATVRGESESTTVADGVAKNLAKHFASTRKEFEKADGEGKHESARSH